MPKDAWNDERIAILRELWPKPEWRTEAIGQKIGLSKSAIIGKARRLNLGSKTATDGVAGHSPDASDTATNPIRPVTIRLPDATRSSSRPSRRPDRRPDNKGAFSEAVQQSVPGPITGALAQPAPTSTATVSSLTLHCEIETREVARFEAAQPAPVPTIHPREPRTCCWPIGEVGTPGFRYCDAAIEVRRNSYCSEHHAMAWKPADKNQRKLRAPRADTVSTRIPNSIAIRLAEILAA